MQVQEKQEGKPPTVFRGQPHQGREESRIEGENRCHPGHEENERRDVLRQKKNGKCNVSNREQKDAQEEGRHVMCFSESVHAQKRGQADPGVTFHEGS